MFLGKRNYFSLTKGLFNAYPKKGSGLVHCPSSRVSKRAGSLGGGMCLGVVLV